MVGGKLKNEEIKMMIGKAIERCTGHHMQGVKRRLLGALNEISDIETKIERRRSTGDICKQQVTDMASAVAKMNKLQANNAIGKIENMIADEQKKIGGSESSEMFMG
jgi:cell division protein FtsL